MTHSSPARRAYTLIDRGATAIGNRWLERRWSTFLGTTIHLIQQAGSVDWGMAGDEELCLTLNGTALTPMTLGEVAWSEENSSFGATLIATWTRPDVIVTVRNFVFHQFPALVRTVTLGNVRKDTLRLEQAVTDRFILEPNGTELRLAEPDRKETTDTALRFGGSAWLGDQGLAFGTGSGVRVASETAEAAVSFHHDTPLEVPPGRRYQLPPTCIAFHIGPEGEAADRLLPEIAVAWEEALGAAEALPLEPDPDDL